MRLVWDTPTGNIYGYKVIRNNENNFGVIKFIYWLNIPVMKNKKIKWFNSSSRLGRAETEILKFKVANSQKYVR